MKTMLYFPFIALTMTRIVWAEEKAASAAHATADAITDQEFIARRNASRKNLPAPTHLPPQKSKFSLMNLSTFVGDGEHFAILPQGSVLYCPEPLATRILASPGGKLISFQEFLSRNRQWITHADVTSDQVSGKTPISDATLKAFEKNAQIVIATYQGAPITVLKGKSTASVPQP
ncbi:hypothetical protein JIN85_16445 [Luteolibacter pohnpeiensis]|uniref:Uncharacterized protein n=1 Tax=Luteolibacter pohnpeiensis TaxID=454153 RepID=A0A934SAP6_9BACT|nr:hypothetical protein [Luteolibacter pohnpeiensis]MBK1884011.1 hypothetical protein [Luteolibacter pohnpeiensis]